MIIGLFWLLLLMGFSKASTSILKEGMALIPAGTYPMGSQKSLIELNPVDLFNTDRHTLGPENPAHNVAIDTYYIDIHEVTHGAYIKYSKAANKNKPRFWNNSDFNGFNQPVVGISWQEAQSYCKSQGGRLPTEAEWEKASRGKRSINYPWGDEIPDSNKLNFNNELNKTAPVGSYEAGKSDYGVYDLSGNVAEWTYDWHFAEFYLFSPKANPIGPIKGHYKVIRGGNWRSKLEEVSMTYRNATVPTTRSNTLGFRCAQSYGSTQPTEYPPPE